jgi:hypothetical protein
MVRAQGQTPEEGMGRSQNEQTKASKDQGTKQAPTSMLILWAVEHEERREEE